MSECGGEPPGLLSMRLYEAAESEGIVRFARDLGDWKAAQVRERQGERVLIEPDVRSARMLVSDRADKLCGEFDRKLDAVATPQLRKLWHVNISKISGTHLIRYGPGDHYVAHQDIGRGLEDRYFSVVCYLNNDFRGGRTLFPTFDYAVTPEAGKAILFPSRYLHGSERLISGEKFVFVSWFIGPVPIKWI